ncbi:MAG: hypothetical protein QOE75_2326 [Solirubrobacterales bacterium]|jgi:hypothetical protein|nr:hypothetical protein [Solirubrobacterales bacterium]
MIGRASRGIFAAAVIAVLLAVLGSGALAYFSGNGSGSAAATVTNLSAPTLGTPTVGGGTVALSWSAVSAPGSGTVRYFVTRDGGDPGVACPAEDAPAAVTSCTDSDVPIGEHSYRVTAVFKSWTAASGLKTAKVLTGAATTFTIAASTTTPAANASVNLTITAKDSSDNTVTSYTGSKSLVFSGASASPSGTKPTVANSSGTATSFGSATTITFTNGVAAVSSSKNGLMKLYRSGLTEIEADQGSISTPDPLAVTVSPGAASKFALAAATTTPTAGASDDLTITAQDVYANTATAYTGQKSVVFSGASASPGGNAPTVADEDGDEIAFGTATEIGFTNGVAAGGGGTNGTMKLYKSGSASIQATQGSLTNSTKLAITVAAAPAAKFVLTASATSIAATASTNLTTTAQDVYANTATAYAGSKSITFSGASASPTGTSPTVVSSGGTVTSFGTPTALTFSNGVAAVSSSKNGLTRLPKAGAASVSATDGTISSAAPLVFTTSPGTASRVAFDGVAASAGTVSPTCRLTCPVTSLGNSGTVSGGFAITDTLGNAVTSIGSAKTITVTVTTGGTITGSPLTIPAAGEALTATDFLYIAPASGSFSHTITAASSGYTSATALVTK